jgi:sigma-54 dependent transcriptional regulator, acetoin dehydrogenase operon transcriptional activator AcoR
LVERPASSRLLLSTARVDFLESGTSPELHGIPELVAASWKRSASSGVASEVFNGDFSEEYDAASRLAHAAAPVVEQLAEQLMDVPTCVAVTDENARIVQRVDSDPWFARLLDRVYFAQGFGYAEGSAGTNGVGTVLEAGGPVQIVGEEHFVSSLQSFACAGAPVRDPFTGRVEGILDISGLSDHWSPVFYSMVRSAAARIEQNLLLDRDLAQQALLDQYSRIEPRTPGALLAVGSRVVLSNSALKQLVTPDDHLALEEHLRFVMERRNHIDDRIDLPSGERVRIRGTRVVSGSGIAGMIARIDLAHEVVLGTGMLLPTQDRRSIATEAARVSPSLRAAERTIVTGFLAGEPVLVLGEPGSGRTALLRREFLRLQPTGAVVVDPEDALAVITGQAQGPTLCLLRDVDRMPVDLATVLAAGLRAAPRTVLLAATGSENASPAQELLLPLFRHCATVPPLRHRLRDLPGLIQETLAEQAPGRAVRLSPDALRLLERYPWPGNITQLCEVIAHALRRRPVGQIEAQDLPAICQSAPRSALRPVDEAERDAIVAALRDHAGNRKAAATELGLARSTLYRKIHQYGITA